MKILALTVGRLFFVSHIFLGALVHSVGFLVEGRLLVRLGTRVAVVRMALVVTFVLLKVCLLAGGQIGTLAILFHF